MGMTMPEAEIDLSESLEALEEALLVRDGVRVWQILEDLGPEDQRWTWARLNEEERDQVVHLLEKEDLADLVQHLAEAQAVELLEELTPDEAADIVEELPDDVGGHLLREMDDEESAAIIERIQDKEDQQELRERIEYEWDSAGGMMSEAMLAFPAQAKVGEVLDDLSANAEEYADHDVQYAYVVDAGDRLLGVLRLRDLVLTPRTTELASIMIGSPHSVRVEATLRELADFFDDHNFIGLPVVDADGRLKGVVLRDAVREALADNSAADYLRSRGIVGGEELRSMPLAGRCLRRLSWLAPNIVLNLVAASVIAANESTLEAVIALAVFLPIVSDMSGCSGNQAVAVSIRELTLGTLRPRDFLLVFFKEASVGIINGLVLGALLGGVASLWKGSVILGLVVGGALALNTILSVLIGGLVPLMLKRFKVDPALASGPILTTCTDLCGFFLVLTIAKLFLEQLAGL